MARKLILYVDNARPPTAKVTLDFLERNTMKIAPRHQTHQPWPRLTLIFSAMSSNP
jgi:hypothetical protein